MKRVFLIVLDSLGIGEMPDSHEYGDYGVNTLNSISKSAFFKAENLGKLGLFNIDGVSCGEKTDAPLGAYCRLAELSRGKDTTIGHWEIAGIVSEKPLPTYPEGFPECIIKEFSDKVGRGVICNRPYSGTEVIKDYGKEHMETGDLIVYTSADSVFQIAAHEDVVPVAELYEYCEIARKMLVGKHGVGRVIARPFAGSYPFERTARRHDYSLKPPKLTMLNVLKNAGYDVISVGKICDIFAGEGVSESNTTTSNADGMQKTSLIAQRDFCGLCFVNLVDFDSKYGHRNDRAGYARAMSEFDLWLSGFIPTLKSDDVLIITADHGCDPSTPSTDHSREYTPMLILGEGIKSGVNLGTRASFADIGATVCEIFGQSTNEICGQSFYSEVKKD